MHKAVALENLHRLFLALPHIASFLAATHFGDQWVFKTKWVIKTPCTPVPPTYLTICVLKNAVAQGVIALKPFICVSSPIITKYTSSKCICCLVCYISNHKLHQNLWPMKRCSRLWTRLKTCLQLGLQLLEPDTPADVTWQMSPVALL